MQNNNSEHQIFISYAHIDNQTLTPKQEGWISFLHRALEIRLAQLTGERPNIWRDPKLQGNDRFDEEIVKSVDRAKVMVAVVSPGYVASEWCHKEIEEFVRAVADNDGLFIDNKSRIFKVVKTWLPLEEHPPEIRNLLGYEFFSIDQQTRRLKEFNRGFGCTIEPEYMDRLEDLANDICELLKLLKALHQGGGAPAPGDTGICVYLSETTTDLMPVHDQIRRELAAHGHRVLPDRCLPQFGPELEKSVREDLERCTLSIHLIGAYYGLVPEAADHSNVEIQLALAGALSREQEAFSRLIWLPEEQVFADERQEGFVNTLMNDTVLQPGDDLLKSSVEDLKTVIQDRLDQKSGKAEQEEAAAEEDALVRIYLIYDLRDMDDIEDLEDYLYDREYEVLHPLFDGDASDITEEHRENLKICDAVLIYHGHGDEAWLRGKLRDLRKAAGYGRTGPIKASAVYVARPEDPRKKRFKTHEVNAVIRNFESFTPECLAPFLTELIS